MNIWSDERVILKGPYKISVEECQVHYISRQTDFTVKPLWTQQRVVGCHNTTAVSSLDKMQNAPKRETRCGVCGTYS